jgi:hypothetical protein
VILQASSIQIPLNMPFSNASFSSLLNPLTIGRNKRGERGHPYPRPIPSLNKGGVDPLIKTRNDIEVIQLIIQTTKL